MVGAYFFIANGRITPSSLGVRNLAFNWTDEYAYYCKVQFSTAFKMSTSGDKFLEEFMTGVNELTSQLLPQLMRCLPDWAEIENPDSEPNPESVLVSNYLNETK